MVREGTAGAPSRGLAAELAVFKQGRLWLALAAMTAVLALIGVLAAQPVAAVLLVVLLGVVSFLVAAPLNARVYELAGAAPTLASATTTSAFNAGNTIGPALGGAVISAGWGFAAPAWVGVALALAAIGLGFVSWSSDARRGQPVAATGAP
jgi:DHA1 family chloramphenicol resistance protein-like MFS transporter